MCDDFVPLSASRHRRRKGCEATGTSASQIFIVIFYILYANIQQTLSYFYARFCKAFIVDPLYWDPDIAQTNFTIALRCKTIPLSCKKNTEVLKWKQKIRKAAT